MLITHNRPTLLRPWIASALLLFCAVIITIPASAQTFSKLADFGATNTSNPDSALVQGTNGNFYGTTFEGSGDYGSVFNVSSQGALSLSFSFNNIDGSAPAGVILAANGSFYGATQYGGSNSLGSVFTVAPNGVQTILYNFSGSDGANPTAGLIQGEDGFFYGTTSAGGTKGLGTVFKITADGVLTTLHVFHGIDGKSPSAALIQGTDGRLYGTTLLGGTSNFGTVFRITTGGFFTVLHNFSGSDGRFPMAALIQAANGNFYGTSSAGGNISKSWCPRGCGGIFKITSAGTFSSVYQFCPSPGSTPCADGTGPDGGLVQTTDGSFYGTTASGGSANLGVIYKLTAGGTLTPLYSFCTQAFCPDGSNPSSALLQGTDGNLYGTAGSGGNSTNPGTIFSFSTGLAPFVHAVQHFGSVGSSVTILGTNLTGATSVTFNGTAASFTVVSPTEITATVPTGATTGNLQVVTPGGTLSSNGSFHIVL